MPHFSSSASLFLHFLHFLHFVRFRPAVQAFPVRALGNRQPAPTARDRRPTAPAGWSALGDCAGGLFRGNGCTVPGGLLWCSGFAVFAHSSNTVPPFFSPCKGFFAVPFLRVSTPRHHWQTSISNAISFPSYALGFRALPHQAHLILSSSLICPPSVCAACRPRETPPHRNPRTQPRRVASRPPPPNPRTTKRHQCQIAARAPALIGSGRFLGIGRIVSLVLLGFVVAHENLRLAPGVRAGQVNHAAKNRWPVVRP